MYITKPNHMDDVMDISKAQRTYTQADRAWEAPLLATAKQSLTTFQEHAAAIYVSSRRLASIIHSKLI